jgi:hypothetical protein
MGDPACWLANVCLACGRFTQDLEEHDACPHCGTAPGSAPASPEPARSENPSHPASEHRGG